VEEWTCTYLVLTCTTCTSMRKGDTVRCLETRKVVSLHDTSETLSDTESDSQNGQKSRIGHDSRIRRHIYKLPRHEVSHTELGTDGQNSITRHPKLLDDLFRMHTCALEVSQHLSGDMLCALRTGIGAS
jgi:hypothetical protein